VCVRGIVCVCVCVCVCVRAHARVHVCVLFCFARTVVLGPSERWHVNLEPPTRIAVMDTIFMLHFSFSMLL